MRYVWIRKNSVLPSLAAVLADWASREDSRAWNHSNEEVSLQTQMNSTRRSRRGGLGLERICQMFLRIDAQGVTPIPVPMSTAISLSNTSSAGAPYGPSTRIAGMVCPFCKATSYMPLGSRPSRSLAWAGPQPSASPSARVKSPTWRTWMLRYGSKGHEVMVNGCHWVLETSGTWRNTHCPALYFMLGLWNWISMAARVILLVVVNPEFLKEEDHTIRMTDDFSDDCHAPGPDLPVKSLEEIQSSDD